MSSTTNIKRKQIKINHWCLDRDEFSWNKEQRNEKQNIYRLLCESALIYACWFVIFSNAPSNICWVHKISGHKVRRDEIGIFSGRNKCCLRQHNCGDNFGTHLLLNKYFFHSVLDVYRGLFSFLLWIEIRFVGMNMKLGMSAYLNNEKPRLWNYSRPCLFGHLKWFLWLFLYCFGL